VKVVLAKYDPLLQWSSLPFFPEYTDHGPKHLSDVLSTSCDLIGTDAWSVLTPADAAGIIVSTLFHDLGMPIAEDGFFALTNKHNDTILIPRTDTQPWPTLWENFILETKRFDQKERMRIFGDSLPVEVPARQSNLLTERDRKLIGEFIRRHHPRLAHEFALFGFQGSSKRLNAISEADYSFLDICGLIARSHGSGLRRFLPYLEQHYSSRMFNGMHPLFLMALLRVSDYLQIQAERAPTYSLSFEANREPKGLALPGCFGNFFVA